MVVDVDGFKKINDQYGHLFGDDVLRGLAALMKEIFGGENLVGRFGGDEFVIFTVKEWDAGKAIEKGKELIRRMEAMGRKMGVKDRFSATIGLSAYQDKDTYSSMFSRADFALMQGKRAESQLSIITESCIMNPGLSLLRKVRAPRIPG